MNPTDDLRAEHKGVLRMLSILDAMAVRARAGDCPDPADLAESMEFLRVFVDQCHHTKEEQLLFPAMRGEGLTEAEPTIELLLAEHDTGRATAGRLGDAVDAVAAEGRPACPSLLGAIAEYSALLRHHIEVEERDCFDCADRELSPEATGTLEEGYERIEREVVGEGRHEQFHEMLDRLAVKYGAA